MKFLAHIYASFVNHAGDYVVAVVGALAAYLFSVGVLLALAFLSVVLEWYLTTLAVSKGTPDPNEGRAKKQKVFQVKSLYDLTALSVGYFFVILIARVFDSATFNDSPYTSRIVAMVITIAHGKRSLEILRITFGVDILGALTKYWDILQRYMKK